MVHEVVPREALYQPGVHTLHAVLLYIAGMALKRPASQWVHFNAAASDQVPAVHALHAETCCAPVAALLLPAMLYLHYIVSARCMTLQTNVQPLRRCSPPLANHTVHPPLPELN